MVNGPDGRQEGPEQVPEQAPAQPRALEVREATVRYEGADRPAVAGASFAVSRGEIVALTGPSGCGKSTLLRAIAGLEPLEAGAVLWEGEDLVRVPPHRRGFGLMFQDGQLFGHLSVAGNVAYGLRAQRVPRPERETRVGELLALVGLPDYGARSVTELSGGERQRVAIARALVTQPACVLADEPTGNLDRSTAEGVFQLMLALARDQGTAFIVVTHDEALAARCARVLRLTAGVLS